MSIHPNDVVSTLQYLGMLKYWKGKHLILIKQVGKVPFRDHPFTTYAKIVQKFNISYPRYAYVRVLIR